MALTGSLAYYAKSVRCHAPGSRGFTLVELLTVISIIALLAAMGLPAINKSREAGRRNDCKNNLIQLSKAALAHLQATNRFPTGGWGWRWVGDSRQGNNWKQPGGWAFNILPYMDQQNIYEMDVGHTDAEVLAINAQRVQMAVPNFNCPSRRRPGPWAYSLGANNANPTEKVARSDYGINSGDGTANEGNGCEITPGPDSLAEGIATGPLADTYTGVSFRRSMVTAAHVLDGMTYTYLIGEKALDSDHYFTGEDSADNETEFTGFDNDNYRSGQLPPVMDSPIDSGNTCRFGSIHDYGFHVAFCDGRIKTIKYSIDPGVHKRLANRKDGNNPQDSEF